jgi:inorganic pyrophosphatase
MNSLITLGDQSPKVVNAIIEIVKQTSNKYEYDEKLDIIKLDRVLHSPMYTGCLLEVRPVGVLIMSDESGDDEKILAVPIKNPAYDEIKKLSDVPEHFLKELIHFFTEYKRLEQNKKVTVKGWLNRQEAYKIIHESNLVYKAEQKQKQIEMTTASSIQD